MSHPAEPAALVEHFFRHESGKLVAVLGRLFGLRNLDLVEDMVQGALLEALSAWRTQGVPDNPAGWMHRVARNKVLDALRRRDTLLRIAPGYARLRPATTEPELDHLFDTEQIEDSQLRLIFAACHPALAPENRIALTLKTLGGFSLAEIARGLLASEEAVKKRLQRAKQQLADDGVELVMPAAGELPARLDSVLQCLYLLFNEGYSASEGEVAIRSDLCEEAVRLCHLLTRQESGRQPGTFALLALMLFHAARFEARTDAQGRLLLLEEQDRGQWDHGLIEQARHYLDLSAEGRQVTKYHLEAGIANLHCAAPSFAATDWAAILRFYNLLLRIDPSPICRLNRAIVIAHLEGPRKGLATLQPLVGDPGLKHYPLLEATLGELHRRAGELPAAQAHFQKALGMSQSEPDRELLRRKLARCGTTT